MTFKHVCQVFFDLFLFF